MAKRRLVMAVRAPAPGTLVVTWGDGIDHTIEVGVHGPADDAGFARVRIAEAGDGVEWPDGSALSAHVLWGMALVQDGARFARWRQARSLTQAGLAEALGLAPEAVRRYEAGDDPIPKTVKLALIGHDALARIAARQQAETPPASAG